MIQSAYDAIVIGGGPAGSTAAALVASAGFKTLLIEREHFPRHHVGESLMPETYWIFERLGMLEKLYRTNFVHKVGVQFVNSTGRESQPFIFRSHDPRDCSETWHVARPEFDAMLIANAVEKGAVCHYGVRAREVLFEGDRAVGVRIQPENDPVQDVACKVVIDATGQSALLANRLGIRRVDPDLKKAAIWGHFRGASREVHHGGVSTIVIQTPRKTGWFWYIPQADDIVSVGVVSDNDYLLKRRGTPEDAFYEEVDNCPAVKRRIEGSENIDGLRVVKEYSYLNDRPSGDGWVLAGDAWGFIDPLYSSGVYFGMKSGELVADCVIEALRTGDTSAEMLGKWGPGFKGGTLWVRKLVKAYYTGEFRVGKFIREYPHHKAGITDILIGRIFGPTAGAVFADLEPWLERRKQISDVEDEAEVEDPTVPSFG
ncbi:MAG: NAD(P)/FAD-dependent oxidoreductase [Pirellulales bacterium]